MKKITDLPVITTAAGNDVLPIIDISANQTAQITKQDFLRDSVDTVDIKNNAVTTGKLPANAVTKASHPTLAGGAVFNSTTLSTWINVPNASGSFTSQNGGDLLVDVYHSFYKNATGYVYHALLINGTRYPSIAGGGVGWQIYVNAVNTHIPMTMPFLITGLPAGTYTVQLQMNNASGQYSTDTADFFSIRVVELKK